MELYFRFMTMLAVGLLGVSAVLKVLLDSLFNEWDAVADAKDFVKGVGAQKKSLSAVRAEDFMLEIEKAKSPTVNPRLLEQRREELKELDAVEYRLKLPNREPIVLPPLRPPSAEPEAVAR